MPFGLQGAPGVFQELMEILATQCKQDPKVRQILTSGHLASFFDDTGVGTLTEEEHFYLLERWFQTCLTNNIRIKLSKCSFLEVNLDYLGYSLSWGTWMPSPKRVQSIMNAQIGTLKDLRSFLGALGFYRRHVKNFTFSSAPLSDLLKKTVKWRWTEVEQRCFEELKEKIAQAEILGVPKSTGELVMITDASDIGGGSTIFQWQTLDPLQIPSQFTTLGVNSDGSFKHNFPSNFRLVPLGHWNWKWNEARQKYHAWEQEMLSGVLTLASQTRIVSNLPIVWFTDNEALTSFLDKEPPLNKRQRRWYVFLSQFQLKVFHLPGLKNELCDFLSRNAFDELINHDFEELAKEAFVKMDAQLDFYLRRIFLLSDKFPMSADDYVNSEFGPHWQTGEPSKTFFMDEHMFYRTDQKLFCERKLVTPKTKVPMVLKMCHESNNHPGAERTVLFFLKHFYSNLTRSDLLQFSKEICDVCPTCLLSKPNRSIDRGEISSLPLPQICNDMLYIDFIQMDSYNNFDYVLTVVDALSHFVQFFACQKAITGEGTLKLLFERWIAPYGKPNSIHSDNDVRFKAQKGFYQTIFRALDIETHFSVPRHPSSNGLCENENRAFLQNMRALSLSCKTNNWPMLVPYCTWLMNSQVSPTTSLSPHEMFLGRLSWPLELVPEPNMSPDSHNWLTEQLLVQEQAHARLQKLRAAALKRANKGGLPLHINLAIMFWCRTNVGPKNVGLNCHPHGRAPSKG